MIFGNLLSAYLLLLLAPIIILLLLGNKGRQRALESFARKELLRELLVSVDGKKRGIRAAMVFFAFILCILALMRPQGGVLEEKEKRRGLDVIVAVDTSKSMLSEDVRPNRLDLSKTLAANLVKQLRGDRIGLIAFAGKAFLACPLTVDYNAFLQTLHSLDENAIPLGGTSLSGAIHEAIQGFKEVQAKAGILIMITDGEDHEGDPNRTVAEAKDAGITIFTMGVGTKEGELIVSTDANSRRSFLKDRQGNVVKSRLNEALLTQIASAAGGRYIRMTGMSDPLPDIQKDWFSEVEKRGIEGRTGKHYREYFQIPLTLALLLLIGETLTVGRKKGG